MESRNTMLNVIIPCWNVEEYITDMLDSIINQTYNSWRAFAVDDGSTDNTANILLSYQKRDPRIIYIKRYRDPKGSQTCRNIGIELSKNCKYIMFIDGDDVLAPYCFEQRVLYMETHPEIDFSVFPAKVFNTNTWDCNKFIIGIDDGQDDLSCFFIKILPFSIWNCIFKISSLKEKNIQWDDKLKSFQDTDFAIQCIVKKMNYNYCKGAKIDYFWRVAPQSNSITNKIKTKEHCFSHLYLYNKLYTTIMNHLQKKQEKYLLYSIITLIEDFKHIPSFRKKIKEAQWMKNNIWFSVRVKFYLHLPNNNKIKHLLFPDLVKLYLKTEKVHNIALLHYKKTLL